MSDPNDKFLDEYLTRDSAVSQHYRKLDAEDVPPELDAAVIARARAAVSPNRSHTSRWRTWAPPVALAASMLFAVTIVLEIGLDDEVRMPAPKLDTPRPAPASEERIIAELTESIAVQPQFAPPPVETVAHRASTDMTESLMREQLASEREEQARKSSERVSAPPPASAPASDTSLAGTPSEPAKRFTSLADATLSGEAAAREARASKSQAQVQTTSATPSAAVRQVASQRAASPPPPAAEAAQAPRLPPEEWLKQIRDLRRDGKVIEADEQWREFARAYPDVQVSETDSARPAREN